MSDFVIQTNGLTKIYDDFVVKDLSLYIPKGSLFALLGRNGAGKTTALKMILGILAPSLGSSTLLGQDSLNLSAEVRQKVTFIDEKQSIYDWMSVSDVIKFTAPLYVSWDVSIQNKLLGAFELDGRRNVGSLSPGQKARLSLVLAVAPQPEVLILDDISSQLDTVARKQFITSIIEIMQEEGRTVLFSSHLLTEVERLADYIAIIDKGTLKLNSRTEQLKEDYKKIYITFKNQIPDIPCMPGEISRNAQNRSLAIITQKFTQDIMNDLRKHDPAEIYAEPMSLDDIFIEITKQG